MLNYFDSRWTGKNIRPVSNLRKICWNNLTFSPRYDIIFQHGFLNPQPPHEEVP